MSNNFISFSVNKLGINQSYYYEYLHPFKGIKLIQFKMKKKIDCTDVCYMYRSIGVCFDVRNNMIWMCSNDWVDQFFNPGHQSPHHIHRRLKVMDEVILPPG